MVATLTFPDLSTFVVKDVIIPITNVHKQGLLQWLVDPCIGADVNNLVIINLPEEPVRWKGWTITALAIPITGTVMHPTLGKGIIEGSFPDCPVNIFTMTANVVTATGTVTFP